MKIVVIGGSGLIGTKLVNDLRKRGSEVVAASPSTGVNTVTGEGLTEALIGTQVVVDVANAPMWEDNAVLAFFETSGRNLLAAEAELGELGADEGRPLMRTERLSTINFWDNLLAHFDFMEILKTRIAQADLNWSVGRVTIAMALAASP